MPNPLNVCTCLPAVLIWLGDVVLYQGGQLDQTQRLPEGKGTPRLEPCVMSGGGGGER